MLAKPIFRQFESFLKDRLWTGQHLTEDSVRYSFFAALIHAQIVSQHEVILERPHPKIAKVKIDTYFCSEGSDTYLEFNFYRKSQSSSAKPH